MTDFTIHSKDCAFAYSRVVRLSNAFLTDLIRPDEFAANAFLILSSLCETCLETCLAELNSMGFAQLLLKYAESQLVPVDFRPCPKPFLTGNATLVEIEQAKESLRPKYLKMYHILERNVSR